MVSELSGGRLALGAASGWRAEVTMVVVAVADPARPMPPPWLTKPAVVLFRRGRMCERKYPQSFIALALQANMLFCVGLEESVKKGKESEDGSRRTSVSLTKMNIRSNRTPRG